MHFFSCCSTEHKLVDPAPTSSQRPDVASAALQVNTQDRATLQWVIDNLNAIIPKQPWLYGQARYTDYISAAKLAVTNLSAYSSNLTDLTDSSDCTDIKNQNTGIQTIITQQLEAYRDKLTQYDSQALLPRFDGQFGIQDGMMTYENIKAKENNETVNKQFIQSELSDLGILNYT